MRLRAEQSILEPLSRIRGSAEVKISGPMTNACKLYLKEMMEAKESVLHRLFQGLSADGHRDCEPAFETLEQMPTAVTPETKTPSEGGQSIAIPLSMCLAGTADAKPCSKNKAKPLSNSIFG